MGWPYKFITLSDEEKHLRRLSLESHARIAHWSAFAPALLYLVLRLVGRVRRMRARRRGGRYAGVPGSPAVKARRLSPLGELERNWDSIAWWLGGDVEAFGARWGQRDEWLLGGAWMAWLLVLCVQGTGQDYLHLTKRFGIIAISQFPIQYLLALKTLNPFAYVFRSSHEQINRYHRVLGRLIHLLLTLHAIFYNIFFIGSGIWLTRFFAPVVFAGVLGYLALCALSTTAVAYVRELSYRVFFITHLAVAFAVPAMVYYHAASARLYLIEALVLFMLDLAARKIITVMSPATVELIPGTNLLKVTASLPLTKAAKYRGRPGAHIYLSIPPASRPSAVPASRSYLLFEFMYNPFSVSSVDEQSGDLTFVARARSGPVTHRLAELASSTNSENSNSKIPLNIEGPYGAATKVFQELLDINIRRILLIAGGVGATFAVPIYHAVQAENPSARIQLVWAIRSPGDAAWAAEGSNGKTLLEDDNVDVYLTSGLGVADDNDNAAGVPMESLQPDPQNDAVTAQFIRRRPNIDNIVSETFRQDPNEKIAVLICGPAEMAREARKSVTPWVMKGRKVWWHSESFGW